MRNSLAVAKKELRGIFTNIASYVVLAVFVVLWEWLFFRNALLVGEASLRNMYDLLPWLTLVVVPAVTMGSVVNEKNDGTLELVLTRPVKEWELVVGKWLANWAFVGTGLLFALPVAMGFAAFGQFDWGVFGAQLVASLFLTGAMVAMGVWVSAISGTAIAALLVSVAMGFVGIMIGSDFVTQSLPIELSGVLARLSTIGHMQTMARGVIDLRDVWYFGSVVAIFLSLTYLQLIKRKYGKLRSKYASTQVGVYLVVAIILVTNVLGDRIGGRLDLTAAGQYSLSATTKKTLKEVPDIVSINVYVSANLPPQYTPVVRDIKDLLADYKNVGGQNIVLAFKNPSIDPKVAGEATSRGVREVQFNVIGQEELQLKTGYLGIAIDYAGRSEVLPFVAQTQDLEYQLTSALAKLTTKERKKIEVLAGPGQKDIFSDLGVFNTELVKQFDVSAQPATDAAALIVPGFSAKIDEAATKSIEAYVSAGKPVILLVDTYNVSPEILNAGPNDTNANDVLKKYGVTVNQNVVYDLRANETVRLGSQEMSYLLPYPYWVKAISDSKLTFAQRIQSVVMPWASSITLDEAKLTEVGYTAQKLLVTSKFAGVITGNLSLSPDQATFPETGLDQQTLAVVLESAKGKGKIVVVGDSDWLTDQFAAGGQNDNLTLGLGLVAYVTDGQNLAEISAKRPVSGPLMFNSFIDIILVKYGNLTLAVLLPMVIGGVVVWRRRRLQSKVYGQK